MNNDSFIPTAHVTKAVIFALISVILVRCTQLAPAGEDAAEAQSLQTLLALTALSSDSSSSSSSSSSLCSSANLVNLSTSDATLTFATTSSSSLFHAYATGTISGSQTIRITSTTTDLQSTTDIFGTEAAKSGSDCSAVSNSSASDTPSCTGSANSLTCTYQSSSTNISGTFLFGFIHQTQQPTDINVRFQ